MLQLRMDDMATPEKAPKSESQLTSSPPTRHEAKSPPPAALLKVFTEAPDDPMEQENAEALLVLASAEKAKRSTRAGNQKDQEVDAARVLVGFGASPGVPRAEGGADPRDHLEPPALERAREDPKQAARQSAEEKAPSPSPSPSSSPSPSPEQEPEPEGPRWRPFRLARAFARELGFETAEQWREWADNNSSVCPEDVPVHPNEAYAGSWLGWEDFLMTETVRKEKLMETLRAIGLDEAPLDVTPVRATRSQRTGSAPATPKSVKSPGTSRTPAAPGSPATPKPSWSPKAKPSIAKASPKSTLKLQPVPAEPLPESTQPKPRPDANPEAASDHFRPRHPLLNGRWLAYEDAREFAIGLGFSTYKEWTEWCAAGKRPDYVPSSPNQTYERNGWVSWLVFFGIVGATEYPPAPPKGAGKGTFSNFAESRAYVRALGLGNSHRNWRIWGLSRERPLQVPLHPDKAFKNRGWLGWEDWLVGPTSTASMPKLDPGDSEGKADLEPHERAEAGAKSPVLKAEAPVACGPSTSGQPEVEESTPRHVEAELRGGKRPGSSVPELGPRKRLASRALEMATATVTTESSRDVDLQYREKEKATAATPREPHPASCSVSSSEQMFLSSSLEVHLHLRDEEGGRVPLDRFPEDSLRAEPLGSLCCSPSGSGGGTDFVVTVDVGKFLRDPFAPHAVQWMWVSGGRTTVVAALRFGQIAITAPEADRYRHEVRRLAEDIRRRSEETEQARAAFSEMGLTDQAGWHDAQLKMLALLAKFYKESFGVVVESN